MDFRNLKKLNFGNVDLRELYFGRYCNLVPASVDTDGSVFGYIDGYRLNSSDGQAAQANTTTSGFIPCKDDSVIRMRGTRWLTGGAAGDYSYLSYYDSNYQLLGYINNCHNGSGGSYAYNVGKGLIDWEKSNVSVNAEMVTTFEMAFASGVDVSKITYFRLSVIGEGKKMVVTVDEELIDIQMWRAATFTNQVPISTEADGVTLYNGGLGYKTGTRVRSGGAEGGQAGAVCTGFIPCKAGQTIRAKDKSGMSIHTQLSTSCAINFSDASRTNLGQIVGNYTGHGTCAGIGRLDDIVTFHSDNMWEYTVPNTIGNVAYVRLTVFCRVADYDKLDLIVTIDEEIV